MDVFMVNSSMKFEYETPVVFIQLCIIDWVCIDHWWCARHQARQ